MSSKAGTVSAGNQKKNILSAFGALSLNWLCLSVVAGNTCI